MYTHTFAYMLIGKLYRTGAIWLIASTLWRPQRAGHVIRGQVTVRHMTERQQVINTYTYIYIYIYIYIYMAACHRPCTNWKRICATGFIFIAETWREHESNTSGPHRDHQERWLVICNNFHRVWIKMLQLFAPAGAPEAKITWNTICLYNIQKLCGAAGHTKRQS